MLVAKLEPDENLRNWHLYKTDPEKYLDLCHRIVQEYPDDPCAYGSCHTAWLRVGRPDKAMEDIETAIRLRPDSGNFAARGELLYLQGDIAAALKDFDRAEALDPADWSEAFGPVYRAQCHAHLGNLEAALRDCQSINDQHWTPGIHGMLPGNRAEITAQIVRIAGEALRRKS